MELEEEHQKISHFLFSLFPRDLRLSSCLRNSQHSTQSLGSLLISIPFFFSPLYLQLPTTSLLSQVLQQGQARYNMTCQQVAQILTFHGSSIYVSLYCRATIFLHKHVGTEIPLAPSNSLKLIKWFKKQKDK